MENKKLIYYGAALTTGSLVLGRPIMFCLDGKKTEAVKLLFYTTVSLFVLLLLATGGLILLR